MVKVFAIYIFSHTHIFLHTEFDNQDACLLAAHQITTNIQKHMPNRFTAECITIAKNFN